MSESATANAPAKSEPTTAPAPSQKPAKPLAPPFLPSSAIRDAGVLRAHWAVLVPAHHTIEDAQHASYLGQKAEFLRRGDRVELRHELFHFLLEGIVLSTDKIAKTVHTAWFAQHDLRAAVAGAPKFSFDGAVVDHTPGTRFRVVLNHKTLKSGFPTEAKARAWMRAIEVGDVDLEAVS